MKSKDIIYKKDLDLSQLEYEKNTFINPLKCKLKTLTGKERCIKLPKYIYFKIQERTLYIDIQEQTSNTGECLNATCINMQSDNAAFEGWVITLKAWLPSMISTVVLKWVKPSVQNKHYNRFLYRVRRFSERYAWFSVDSENEKEVENFFHVEWKKLTINTSNAEPLKKSNDENAVEYEICDKERTDIRQMFLDKYDLELFNHQLHVGVKSDDSLLFTGKQSAIDLWAVSKDRSTLSVFELKYINYKKNGIKNIKVGIISELFLYVCIIEDIIKGNIEPDKAKDDERQLYSLIRNIKKINAIMLSNEFHPLVASRDVLKLLNSSDNKEGHVPIEFQTVNYSYELGSYEFKFEPEI